MENILVIDICISNIFNAEFFEDLDNNKDVQALGNYDAFIINAMGTLLDYGYEIIDEYPSESKNSLSYYILAIKKKDIEAKNIKVVLNIRLSNHPFSDNSEEKRKARAYYYKTLAQKYKKPENKSFQKWQFYNIIVNDHDLDSYDKALDYLETALNKVQNKFYLEEE